MSNFIKTIVQKLLGIFGMRIARKEIYPELSFPFEILDFVIHKYLSEKNDLFFVQIGANDGVMSDKLNKFIRKYKLKGILVEPMPDVYQTLLLNYKDQQQLMFENCAIGRENKSVQIYRFKPGSKVPNEFYHGLSRLDGNYIRERAQREGLSDCIEELVVPMWTFEKLIQKHEIKEITLLYVDTEGYDKIVIESCFDAGKYPLIINYEWTEMSDKDNYELKMILLDNGYKFIDIGADTLCLKVGDANVRS